MFHQRSLLGGQYSATCVTFKSPGRVLDGERSSRKKERKDFGFKDVIHGMGGLSVFMCIAFKLIASYIKKPQFSGIDSTMSNLAYGREFAYTYAHVREMYYMDVNPA